MISFSIPAFGETDFFEDRENQKTRAVLIPGAAAAQYQEYCALLEHDGFRQRECFTAEHRCFAAYEKAGCGVFLNWFANTAELQLVVEEDSTYFYCTDSAADPCTTPRLTQVGLEDYGLSYVLRLSDGRLLVIDGGNVSQQDADALFARLKQDSPHEKPVIAGWIMTHPHSDHFYCFFPFMEKYGKEVLVEKFFFSFPQGDDVEHYPKLGAEIKKFAQWCGKEVMLAGEPVQMFTDAVADMNVPVYTPHTGQTYRLGDARIFFAATRDDSIHYTQNINASSLMFTVELGGQKIFFGADGSFSDTRLPDRYGRELKSDILQVPHHGFGCGTAEAQIRGYRLIDAPVCLLPTGMDIAYTSFTTYREGTNYLMTCMDVQEMITGERERTLELPYAPDPAGKQLLRQRYLEGRDNSGARAWIFTDLNTGEREDFIFTLLNTTYLNAELTVELYFENMQKKIVTVKNRGLRLGVFRLNCLLDPEEDQTVFDAPDFLQSRDIPENTGFAVRFISSLPVVISHRNHAPAYHATII